MSLGTQFYKFPPPNPSGQTPHPKIQTFHLCCYEHVLYAVRSAISAKADMVSCSFSYTRFLSQENVSLAANITLVVN